MEVKTAGLKNLVLVKGVLPRDDAANLAAIGLF